MARSVSLVLLSLARLAGGWIFCPELCCDTSSPAPGVPWQGEGELLGEGGICWDKPAFCFPSFLPLFVRMCLLLGPALPHVL